MAKRIGRLSETRFTKLLDKAEDIVWYVRSQYFIELELKREQPAPSADIAESRAKSMRRIEKTYPDIFKKEDDYRIDDYEYGFWTGVMGALRAVESGDDEFDLSS